MASLATILGTVAAAIIASAAFHLPTPQAAAITIIAFCFSCLWVISPLP